MSTIFPDCYDEWSLEKLVHGSLYQTLFEGTEDECRSYAYNNFDDEERKSMILMDWEGREWDV